MTDERVYPIDFFAAVERADVGYLARHAADQNGDDLNWCVRRTAEIGDVVCLRILLNVCPSFNRNGKHAIISAAHFKQVECVKELLTHPATYAAYAFNAPLQKALQNNDPVCTAVLAPNSNFLMESIHVIFKQSLDFGRLECFECLVHEIKKLDRVDALKHCIIDSLENAVYDVAHLLTPQNSVAFKYMLDNLDKIQHPHSHVWLTDQLFKMTLNETMNQTIGAAAAVKRKL